MSLWHPARAYPSLDYKGVGLFRTFTAGASITAGQVVSLHSDGKVYPSSSSYPNVVGVALDNASAGGLVRVLIAGIVDVVADGAISAGSFVTFSTATAGRVVSYGGHSHTPSTTTASAITGVSTSSATVVSGISKSTGTFVTGISVDRRDFTTGSAVTGVSTTSGTFLTGIGDDTGWYTDASGYARHKHGTTTGSALTGASTSTGSFVTGITSTAGATVTANVSASTGTAVTDVTASTASVVGSVSTSSGTFVTGVSIGTTLARVIGIALTSSTAAGQVITILVIPSWI